MYSLILFAVIGVKAFNIIQSYQTFSLLPSTIQRMIQKLIPTTMAMTVVGYFFGPHEFHQMLAVLLTAITVWIWSFAYQASKHSINFLNYLIYFGGIGIFLLMAILTVNLAVRPYELAIIQGAILFCGLITHGIVNFLLTARPTSPTKSSDKVSQYRNAGLNDQEILYFREQMATALDHIQSLKDHFNVTARLRAIEERHNTIKAMQDFFQAITNEPTRIAVAGDFLYQYLPQLDELVRSYNEINAHTVKNKQTYLILDKSAQAIEELAEQINQEYFKFHQRHFDHLDDQIKVVHRSLNKDTNSHDLINELLNNDSAQGQEDLHEQRK